MNKSLSKQYSVNWHTLEQTHDLSLPDWGPYSSQTFGLSHLHDKERGSRLDMVLIPGFYRRPLALPDARRPSGGIPWRCSDDLKQFSYRQQLEWKDKVYADLEFIECSESAHLLRCRLNNATKHKQDLAVHLLTRLIPLRTHYCSVPDALEIIHPELPGCGLNSDLLHPEEVLSSELILQDSVYSLKAGMTATFHAQNDLTGKQLYLYCQKQNENWQFILLPPTTGKTVQYTSSEDIRINRLAVLPENGKAELICEQASSEVFAEKVDTGKYLLRFKTTGDCYGICSVKTPSFHRSYLSKNLISTFTYCDYVLQKHPGDKIYEPGGTEGAFDIAIQPVTLAPDTEECIDFYVWNGTEKEIRKILQTGTLPQIPAPDIMTLPVSPYTFSMERMASVIMTNVVFPIRCSGKYIRNHTPGRLWNCLYTWDSGFIGLALLDLNLQRAIENLNAYLTEKGNTENAFVLHGTPLPMQIFLLFELWNRTCDKTLLRHFYPRVKQMYDYLAGHTPGSSTRKHCNKPFICTWDYFYNSGGWDDYPPQWTRLQNKEKDRVIPAISTSAIIRSAKLLRFLAEILGETTEQFDQDIQELTQSLQEYSWDSEAEYFSYVTVNEQGDPDGFFRYKDGTNYNMGLDGTSPLIAGAVTPEQKEILWQKLQSEKHLWCRAGISTVDQSAPYFTPDGYWNGSVWFPHQWLLWKAALNDGLERFAEKIASNALKIWERETHKNYACYEQFSVTSSFGMGWHHFSGLSSPVICWHRAYFEEDALTAGYDVLITSRTKSSWNLKIAGNSGEKTSLIYGGTPKEIKYQGKKIHFRKTFGHSVVFNLPKNTEGLLEIH